VNDKHAKGPRYSPGPRNLRAISSGSDREITREEEQKARKWNRRGGRTTGKLFESSDTWEIFQVQMIVAAEVSQMEVFERKVVCGMTRRGRVSGEGLRGRTIRTRSFESISASDYFTFLCFCRTQSVLINTEKWPARGQRLSHG
jgi:hypothetical protein